MKRTLALLAALALCLCLIIPAGAADAQSANLKFKDGAFKIIQVADTQEFILSATLTQEFIYDLAEKERPDLFVLTGDNVSTKGASYFPKAIAKMLVKLSVDNLMQVFDKVYKDFGIPVTMVYGNHDNEAGPDRVTRAEQFAMYQAHPSFIGYYVEAADKGTIDTEGQHYGTHNILVKNSAGTAPAFNIWLFDSGSYDPAGGYSCVQPQQIEWFQATNNALDKLPSIAFQHIIVKDVYDLLTPEKTLPEGVKGELRENPAPGQSNFGQYEALSEGGVSALFVGHDHVNTYEFKLEGTDLINSSCTGFGSYGDIDLRGARVITIKEDAPREYESEIVTYQTFYGPNTLHRTRLSMFQELSTFGTILDVISFRPLLWLLDLIGMTPAYAPAA